MQKYLLVLMLSVLSFSGMSIAADISSTKWICTTNNQNNTSKNTSKNTDPANKQLVETATQNNDLANSQDTQASGAKLANSSLATAFSVAVKNCEDCTDIHCVMQK